MSSANGSNFLLLDFVSLNQDTCPHVASPSCTSVLDDGHKQLAEDSSLRLFIKKSLCDCNLSSYPFMDYIKLKGHKQSIHFRLTSCQVSAQPDKAVKATGSSFMRLENQKDKWRCGETRQAWKVECGRQKNKKTLADKNWPLCKPC